MIKRLYLGYLIIISIFFQSCENGTTPNNNIQLIPTQIGNYWVYVDSIFYRSPTPEVDTAIGKITNTKMVNINNSSYKVYTQAAYNNKNVEIEKIFISNDNDGLYVFGSDSDTNNLIYRHILLQYPTKVNNNWTCVYYYFNNTASKFFKDTSNAKCVSLNESYTTKAGTFLCVKYHYQIGSLIESYEYYAPDIGMIAHIDLFDGVVIFKRELIRFNLEKN